MELSTMRNASEPDPFTPDERRSVLAELLARGLARLAERHALPRECPPENPSEIHVPTLEAVRNVPLTVHAG
jgi:hypothetical protein